MRYLVIFVAIISSSYLSAETSQPQTVHVAAYDYPPYFSVYSDKHLVGDILQVLNERQQSYRFVLKEIPSKARFKALSVDGCCHMMMFESNDWGWREQLPQIQLTEPIVFGAERFVALRKQHQQDMSFFEQEGLRLGGISGYHYSFLDNVTDAQLLEDDHNVYLSLSHEINVMMLLNGRLDVIMTHDEYLVQLSDETWFPRLLIHEQPFNTYQLHTLINGRKGFTTEHWREVLKPLLDDGTLAQMFANYGLPWPAEPLLLPQPDVRSVDTQAETIR
ncbi:substrate-binding periplasmic protein [Pseudidiomarina sediminum]|uniref:substrate-binding periplasmic protein n=1 Tax=Pseudidiomarina sediminum TaxID=431675 RepID=UPI000F87CE7C|nr:hypothetical protein [Pseudidiomarina sediminum]